MTISFRAVVAHIPRGRGHHGGLPHTQAGALKALRRPNGASLGWPWTGGIPGSSTATAFPKCRLSSYTFPEASVIRLSLFDAVYSIRSTSICGVVRVSYVATKFLGSVNCIIDRECDPASWNGNVELLEYLLALVFVDFHYTSSSSGIGIYALRSKTISPFLLLSNGLCLQEKKQIVPATGF